jgi:endonuclease/exonuclease/phosphatase family metal-dependent hydrolase
VSPAVGTSGRAAAPPPGELPDDVAGDRNRLAAALDGEIPARTDHNLLVGTWNIRALGAVTTRWRSRPSDSPKRDWHALVCLAEVIRRFDVVAVQEARRDTTALFALLETLGPQWRVIASDVTEGDKGNAERLAYLYDSDRVQPSGLVGEIVLPPDATGPVEQFARTPYAAGFVRGETEFILTTVHVLWGEKPKDRLPELTAFAEWMRGWAVRPKDWNRNLLVLGDFNLDRLDDPLYQAFVATGLWPPAELNEVRRTIFDNERERHFYDQIAWFCDPSDRRLPSLLHGLGYTGRGGGFDFVPHVLTDLSRTELSWRISDHYPLWVEFRTG